MYSHLLTEVIGVPSPTVQRGPGTIPRASIPATPFVSKGRTEWHCYWHR
ncbi:MAG: hypothetical protein F2842_08525 [Actinobacteria bacterium]|uniref:Unannotated protein n=1 Tax=freshwater metagenome TaxID=449393 RepID=A0A6J7KQE8_9ZZZZ|nr:hypothetical protein [Actinomycetota bacterium]